MNLFGRWRKKKKESEDKVKKVIYTEDLSNEPKEYEDEDMSRLLVNDYLESNFDSLKELQEKLEKFEQLDKLINSREWYNSSWLDSNGLWGDEVEEKEKPLHEKLGIHNMAVGAVKKFLSDPPNQRLLNNNSWYDLVVEWCKYVSEGDYEYLPVFREDLVKVLSSSGLEIDYDEVLRAYEDCGNE